MIHGDSISARVIRYSWTTCSAGHYIGRTLDPQQTVAATLEFPLDRQIHRTAAVLIDRQARHEYARLLDAEIRKRRAKTIFYLTWARQQIPDVRDTDYPDMPGGGWAGAVSEIHDHGMNTVRWSRETLAAINPVFKKLWNHR